MTPQVGHWQVYASRSLTRTAQRSSFFPTAPVARLTRTPRRRGPCSRAGGRRASARARRTGSAGRRREGAPAPVDPAAARVLLPAVAMPAGAAELLPGRAGPHAADRLPPEGGRASGHGSSPIGPGSPSSTSRSGRGKNPSQRQRVRASPSGPARRARPGRRRSCTRTRRARRSASGGTSRRARIGRRARRGRPRRGGRRSRPRLLTSLPAVRQRVPDELRDLRRVDVRRDDEPAVAPLRPLRAVELVLDAVEVPPEVGAVSIWPATI